MAQKFLTNFTPPGTSDLYKFRAGALFYGTTSNSTTAMTVSIPGVTEYYTGLTLILKMGAQVASGCTLNVNSLGAKAMKYGADSVGTYFTSGATYLFVYDGTDFKAVHSYNSNTTYSAEKGITLSSGKFGHTNSITAKTTYNQSTANPGYGGTFKITEPKYDAYGHITGVQVATITLPSAYTHPTSSGNKHIPSGGSSGQILRWSADGTAAWGADTNTAHSHSAGLGLIGSGSAGTSGTYTYKVNLVNETASANEASYTAGGTSKFYAVQLDKNNKLGVYVPWTDNNTTYTFTNKAATLSWGTKSTIATVGGVDITVTMPANPNTDTHYTTGITAGETGTTSNSATTNGNTFIKIKDNSTHRGQIKIVGSGATTVTSDANGVITISSTDNNTTYGSMSVSEGTTGTATTNRVLTAANLKSIINAHAPTKTGGGASGTWGISISGNAATATKLGKSGLTADTIDNVTHSGLLYGTIGSYTGPGFSGNDAMILSMSWNDSNNYGAQIALDDTTTPNMYVRNKNSSWSAWSKVLLSTNYTDYTVKKDGTGASGNWGISISGNAASASKVNNKLTVGSKSYDGSSAVTITASDLGLSNAMHFRGTVSSKPADTTGYVDGDVILVGNKEYVCSNKAWIELGDESSFSLKGHTHTVTYAKSATTTGSTTQGGTNAETSITPAGTVSQPTFTGTAHTHTFTPTTTTVYSVSSVGTMFAASVSGEVLVLTPGTAPTRSGVTVATGGSNSSVTATGTVSKPTFTGTAAKHTHTFTGSAHTHGITLTNTTVTSST